jgi:lipoprotein-anchoring transpeptidase ErfK/SrfK
MEALAFFCNEHSKKIKKSPMTALLTRRSFLVSAPLFVAGCATSGQPVARDVKPQPSAFYRELYAAIDTEPFPVPAPDLSKIDPQFYRQEVSYAGGEAAGTIVVDTTQRFLYLLLGEGRALRYGVGVGKQGLEFEGVGVIQYKREWPRWTPTQDMIRREPDRYGPLAGGMEPGPTNPLGARALYLFKNGEDTLYRIHGTNEDWSIGRAVSSGCIRLLNQDIIDLHRRVLNGTRVIVLQGASAPMA